MDNKTGRYFYSTSSVCEIQRIEALCKEANLRKLNGGPFVEGEGISIDLCLNYYYLHAVSSYLPLETTQISMLGLILVLEKRINGL